MPRRVLVTDVTGQIVSELMSKLRERYDGTRALGVLGKRC